MITEFKENYYVDSVDAVKALLQPHSSELNISEIYDFDVYNPITPSIAVVFTDSDEELRTTEGQVVVNLGQARYTIYIYLEIWYYHEQFSESTNFREIARKMWQIAQIIRENPTINKYSDKLGSIVTGSKVVNRLRNGSSILAGGLVTVTIMKPISISNRA